MNKPEVFIDGVRYLPAREVAASEQAIMEGLLMQWWGDCKGKTIEEIRTLCRDVRVIVTDCFDSTQGDTVENVIAEITEIQQRISDSASTVQKETNGK